MNTVIKKESAYEFLLLLITFNFCFGNFTFISFASTLKYIYILLLGIMILFRLSSFMAAIGKINYFLFAYIICILISGFINRDAHIYTHTLLNSVAHVLMVFELIFVYRYVIKNNGIEFVNKIYRNLAICYVAITDFLLLFFPYLLSGTGNLYFVGNKFSVAILHIFMVAMIYSKCIKKGTISFTSKMLPIILCVYSLLISLKVDCMTGVVAIIVLVFLMIIPKAFYDSPKNILLAVCVAASFVFIFEFFLSNAFVKSIVENVLHRDLTLTGRTNIYLRIPQVLKNHVLFGYGYGTSYETWSSFVFFMPNSQNGIIDNIVETGVLATFAFTLYVANGIKKFGLQSDDIKNAIVPVIMVIYILLIVSAIEITTGILYCSLCILLNESYIRFIE